MRHSHQNGLDQIVLMVLISVIERDAMIIDAPASVVLLLRRKTESAENLQGGFVCWPEQRRRPLVLMASDGHGKCLKMS